MVKEVVVDVVVVGGGGSGLSAACSAAECGRSVLVIEKNPIVGGSTGWSVGTLSANNTPYQAKKRISDSPSQQLEEMKAASGPLADRDNFTLGQVLVDNISDTFRWLMSIGVEFIGPLDAAPGKIARLHSVMPSSKAYPYYLHKRCKKLGVDIRLSTIAVDLLESDGAITGIETVATDGTKTKILARNGVILATGDYSGSRELKAKFASDEVADVPSINPTALGEGFILALRHGAVMTNQDMIAGPVWRFPAPPPDLLRRLPPNKALIKLMKWAYSNLPVFITRPFLMKVMTAIVAPSFSLLTNGAFLVSSVGKRIDAGDEGAAGAAIARQDDGKAYIVFDQTVADKFSHAPNFVSTAPGVGVAYLQDYKRYRSDVYYQADSLNELAKLISVPKFNNDLEKALTQNEGRKNSKFYALGPLKSFIVLTNGSLNVSTNLEVLDQNAQPIPGLYAAGSTGQGGMVLAAAGYHLAWAFVSGRLAGRNASSFVR